LVGKFDENYSGDHVLKEEYSFFRES